MRKDTFSEEGMDHVDKDVFSREGVRARVDNSDEADRRDIR